MRGNAILVTLTHNKESKALAQYSRVTVSLASWFVDVPLRAVRREKLSLAIHHYEQHIVGDLRSLPQIGTLLGEDSGFTQRRKFSSVTGREL